MSEKQKRKTNKTPGNQAHYLRRKAKELDVQLFLDAWTAGKTLATVAESLGLAPSSCRNYAERLREAGYELKTFARGRPRLFNI
jgi:transposase